MVSTNQVFNTGILVGGLTLVAFGLRDLWNGRRVAGLNRHVLQNVAKMATGGVALAVSYWLSRNQEDFWGSCPQATSKLNEMIQQNPTGLTSKVMALFNETQGITCETFLPWKETFFPWKDISYGDGPEYIGGMQMADMNRSAMWGVDPERRPFIAIRYSCTVGNDGEGSGTFGARTYFQRDPSKSDLWVNGERVHETLCEMVNFNLSRKNELNEFQKLLSKGFVERTKVGSSLKTNLTLI